MATALASKFRVLSLLAPVLALGMTLTACAGSSDEEAKPTPSKPAATAPPEPEFWPLTGTKAPLGTTTKLGRSPLVVKIDNTRGSAPQRGLNKADLIVEEPVEGGVTRLAVFYYENLPEVAGPVRSMRTSDIGIVSPVEADIVTSGAAGPVLDAIKKAGLEYYTEGGKGVYRDTARRAPYNLFTRLNETAELAEREPETVTDYFAWGKSSDFAGVDPVTSFDIPFSFAHTTEWTFEAGKYTNVNSFAETGEEFKPDTVVVVRVPMGTAGYNDQQGNPVPEAILEGTGDALMFHDGKVQNLTWTKSELDAPITLASETGPVTVPTGRTWVEIVPETAKAAVLRP